MSAQEIQQYVANRISAKEFKDDFLQMLRDLRDETGNVTVKEALDDISFYLNNVDQSFKSDP